MDEDKEAVKEELLKIGNLPRHIAIIMDGNGRWAKMRGLPRIVGHRAGIESIRDVVRACGELQIDVLTLYAFSVENWRRPQIEVSILMELLLQTIEEEIDELNENDVRVITIGRLHDLPTETRQALEEAVELTSNNKGLTLNLALSYGGRAEIVDAVKRLAEDVEQGKLYSNEIDETHFEQYLYTADLPDPDLLIRTSGELRVSNFLLWQLAYTEIWVTEVLWPDFRRKHLYQAIRDYQKRERRFGRSTEPDGENRVFG